VIDLSINIHMLRRRFLRIFRHQTYKDVCEREWVISPASTSIAPPAIYLAGETEKITGLEPNTNNINEQFRINGGQREHAATIARSLRDAYLFGDHVYKKTAKIQIGINPEKLFYQHGLKVRDTASLASSWIDSKYFGHWMTDGIPLLMAGREIAPPIRNSGPLTAHQEQYLSMLEMSYESFIGGKIRELIILEDFGQNKYKRARYEKIRECFYRHGNQSSHPGAIILRGMSGVNRALINERQIADYLLSIGFKVIDPQRQSANEIIQATSGARIVVGVEGSHLAHGLFSMHPRGTLLVLQPPNRFNNVHKDYADCMDLEYAFVVGDACDGGFRIPVDHIRRILDLITATQA
jgi:hypothetical protein